MSSLNPKPSTPSSKILILKIVLPAVAIVLVFWGINIAFDLFAQWMPTLIASVALILYTALICHRRFQMTFRKSILLTFFITSLLTILIWAFSFNHLVCFLTLVPISLFAGLIGLFIGHLSPIKWVNPLRRKLLFFSSIALIGIKLIQLLLQSAQKNTSLFLVLSLGVIALTLVVCRFFFKISWNKLWINTLILISIIGAIFTVVSLNRFLCSLQALPLTLVALSLGVIIGHKFKPQNLSSPTLAEDNVTQPND